MDDSEVTAAVPSPSAAAPTGCAGDQSKYCGVVKSFNMCHVAKYQRQCCDSCGGSSSKV